MVFKWFNSDFLQESTIVKNRLVQIIDNEILSIRASIKVAASDKSDEVRELQKLLQSLLVRKSLAEFEAEEIVRKRIDLRIAFSALIFSSVAVFVSLLSIYLKVKS